MSFKGFRVGIEEGDLEVWCFSVLGYPCKVGVLGLWFGNWGQDLRL